MLVGMEIESAEGVCHSVVRETDTNAGWLVSLLTLHRINEQIGTVVFQILGTPRKGGTWIYFSAWHRRRW